MPSMTRNYRELSRRGSFEARFRYLSLQGVVGEATFGYDRWLNQGFYQSSAWRRVRHEVIARDLGCDLGIPGYEIFDRPYVHHMTPITKADLENGEAWIEDPEYLITVSHQTHNAIHFGDERLLPQPFVERMPGDTKLW